MSFPTRRTLFSTAAIAVVAIGATLAGQREVAQRHVYVRVTDAKGAPVSTLTPKDLIVREDDIAREVVSVNAAPPPTHLVLLVDNTNQAQTALIELRAGLTAVARQMNQLPTPPAMMLMTVADRPTRLVDFTASDIAIENGVKKVFPRPGGGAYFLDAIVESTELLRKAKAQRPVILGFVMDSSPEFSDRVHRQVDEALAEARTSLFTVQLQHTPGRVGSDEERHCSLGGLRVGTRPANPRGNRTGARQAVPGIHCP